MSFVHKRKLSQASSSSEPIQLKKLSGLTSFKMFMIDRNEKYNTIRCYRTQYQLVPQAFLPYGTGSVIKSTLTKHEALKTVLKQHKTTLKYSKKGSETVRNVCFRKNCQSGPYESHYVRFQKCMVRTYSCNI